MKKLLLPILTLFLVSTGCENTMRDSAVDLDSAELQDFSSELVSDLGLSKSSSDELNGVLNRHGSGGKYRSPGFLWKVAGDLAINLSDEEKARLFEKMDEKDVPLFSGGMKKGGNGKNGKKGRNDIHGIINVLTDDQKATLKEIMASYKEQFKVIHDQVKDGSLTKDDARSQMEAIKDAMKAEIDDLLTDEQKEQIEQNKADREVKRRAYRDSSKAVMVKVLGMSSDQVASVDAINNEAREAAKSLFEQVKNGNLDKESFRTALKNLFSEKNEKLEALFTAGQLEIIKIHKALELRMKKHRGGKGKKSGRKGKKGGRKGGKG